MAIDIVAAIFVGSMLGVVHVFNLWLDMRRYRRVRSAVKPTRILPNHSH